MQEHEETNKNDSVPLYMRTSNSKNRFFTVIFTHVVVSYITQIFLLCSRNWCKWRRCSTVGTWCSRTRRRYREQNSTVWRISTPFSSLSYIFFKRILLIENFLIFFIPILRRVIDFIFFQWVSCVIWFFYIKSITLWKPSCVI